MSRALYSYPLLEDAYMRHVNGAVEPHLILVSPLTFHEIDDHFSEQFHFRPRWKEAITARGWAGVEHYIGLKFNNAMLVKRRWVPDGVAMILLDGILVETAPIAVERAA